MSESDVPSLPETGHAGAPPDSQPRETLAAAMVRFAAGGMSIVPIDWATKRPATNLLPRDDQGRPTWAIFQRERADAVMIQRWDEDSVEAFAVVGGGISGGVLVLDFDVPRFYDAWRARVGAAADGLPVQRTGGGGYQVFFRCPQPGGNVRLAWAPDAEDASGRTIAIETRGEGGYAIVAPSRHPSGNFYAVLSGDLANPPLVDQARADALLAAARALDEAPMTRQETERAASQVLDERRRAQPRTDGGGVIDVYNRAHSIEEVLVRHGYTRGSGGRFVRPGGTSASVSILNDRSCHWSSNDPLNDGALRPGMGCHDSFGIFCALEHGGNVAAAVRAAAAELGVTQDSNAGAEWNVAVRGVAGVPDVDLNLRFTPAARRTTEVQVRRGAEMIYEDRVDLAVAERRERFADAVAQRVVARDTPEYHDRFRQVAGMIDAGLRAWRAQPPAAVVADSITAGGREDDPQALLAAMPSSVRDAAEEMLNDPRLLRRISDDISQLGVAGERRLAMSVYLIGTSRLLPEPLAGRIHGHSATGKSFIPDQVVRLHPTEGVIRANRMTSQALYHMPEGALKHRWIVAGERQRMENDESAEATRALREMLTSGRLSKLIPQKVHENIITVKIEQEGPIAYTESTTAETVLDEDANRCIYLASDERPEQTRRILQARSRRGAMEEEELATLAARHHALQRMLTLSPRRVVIPYEENLGDLFPAGRPEARRAFGHVTAMIRTVALLHVRQREQDEADNILATADDYAVARELLAAPMDRTLSGALTSGAVRFRERLLGWVGSRTVTSSEVYRREEFTERAVRGWLGELVRVGLLEVMEAGGPGRPASFRVSGEVPVDGNRANADLQAELLPTVTAVCGTPAQVYTPAELAELFNDDRLPVVTEAA